MASRTRPRSLKRLVTLGIMVTFLAVILAPTVRAYVQQRGEISALTQHVAQQQRNVADLKRQTERWKDPAYVEQQARERLKFAKPGERSYTVLEGSGSDAPATTVRGMAAVPSDVHRTRPWYGELWESVVIADAGPVK